MKHVVRPSTDEVKKAKRTIDSAVKKYQYSVDTDDVEFYVNWQKMDGETASEVTDKNEITLIINPHTEWRDSLDEEVLNSLLKIEFMEKAEYKEITFNWQEIAQLAYLMVQRSKLLEEEFEEHDLSDVWSDIKPVLSEEAEDFNYMFYNHAIMLGETIGEKLLEEKEVEEFPKMKRNDILEAGEELFGGE